MSPVDWLAMTPAEQLVAIRAAPPVAGPWTLDNDAGGGIRYYPKGGGLWTRREQFPGHSLNVCVQGPTENGWVASMGMHDSSTLPTADAGKAWVDAKLVAMGWRML